jgi:hypothetical protein
LTAGLELAECETQQTANTYSFIGTDEQHTDKKKKKKKKNRKINGQLDCDFSINQSKKDNPICILEYGSDEKTANDPILIFDQTPQYEDLPKTEELLRLEAMLEESKIKNPRKSVHFGKKAMLRFEKFFRRVVSS